MYNTSIDGVKGNIDEKIEKNGNIFVRGWSFNEKYGVCPVRCKYDETIKSIDISTRPDICENFKRSNIILCGWSFEVPENKNCDIQIKFEGNWHTFFSFNTKPTNEVVQPITSNIEQNNIDDFLGNAMKGFKEKYPNIELTNLRTINIDFELTPNNLPNVIIVDNFYKNPDCFREIGQVVNPPINVTHSEKYFKPVFEDLLGIQIPTFDNYNSQNKFEITKSDDPILINIGSTEFIALIFLAPNAPVNTGITLYRSKITNKMTVSESEKATVFQNGNQDITEFEPVDIIGNVYNRLVIINAHRIHAISHNFGSNVEDGRLVQMFCFDTKKSTSVEIKNEINL